MNPIPWRAGNLALMEVRIYTMESWDSSPSGNFCVQSPQ
ncbi:hypothetical protein SLEP1_g55538 [Rubroshorea leprosula]|uniref:Uncharacterized protein n=1 Tax=Rubroshorea leprosula TaxID=152421 RepID=A0AAV5MGL9_9ROSI|nr:hypothetical protein SLEP1_g55538 [Rubroshorea leprosula]